jgi:hypothetical protein
MKRSKVLLVLSLVLVLALTVPLGAAYGAKGGGSKTNPNPAANPVAATPNLSFPLIATDIIDVFYQKVWVEDDLLGEEGYSVPASSEWIVGYDADGDGVIDNVTGDGLPVPIDVVESITEVYGGSYLGNDGEYYQTYILEDGKTVDYDTQYWNDSGVWTVVLDAPDGKPDLTEPIGMLTWLQSMVPWYDQPVNMSATTITELVSTFDGLLRATIPVGENPNNIWNTAYIDGSLAGGANSWQADWFWTGNPGDYVLPDEKIYVDFIDWGNPLENTVAPIVGQRFPVEVTLHEKVASTVVDDVWGETMTAYKMACLEYPSSRTEIFGTSKLDGDGFTYENCFASVLTKKYRAEVWDSKGNRYPIVLEPGIGPSGKMNFASANGGWIPRTSGWHRIWVYFNDPMISLQGAIVNNDEHYVFSSGWMGEALSKNKLDITAVVGDSIYLYVYVQPATGKKVK